MASISSTLIGGCVDLITITPECTKLFDLKTGIIVSEEGGIKEDYEEQLKLYAYLYSENYHRYPDAIAILDLDNRQYQVEFTPTECNTLAEGAREMLSKINDLINKKDWKGLAQPEIVKCGKCLYRAACEFYWTVEFPKSLLPFCDIKGVLASVRAVSQW